MNIEELEPGKRVVWSCLGDQPEWAGTRLTWELEPDQGRTRVRFVQTNLRSLNDFWASCNSNWGELMFRLKGYAEGKNPGPLWTE